MSKQESVIKENKVYDRYELVELRFKLAYMKYQIEKWKQSEKEEKEKSKK